MNRLRLILGYRVAALVTSALLLLATTAGAAESTAAIEAAIAATGSASVIVTLKTPPLVDATDRAAMGRMIATMRAELEAEGFSIRQTYDNLPMIVVTVDAQQLATLRDFPNIAKLGLNRIRAVRATPSAPASMERAQAAPLITLPATSAHQRAMKADLAWQLGATGRGQLVVAIGNGVDRTHEMFTNKIETAACFSPRFADDEESLCPKGAVEAFGGDAASACPGPDEGPFQNLGRACGIGTHAAGLIAGLSPFVRGMAFDATLVPIQVYTLFNDERICGFGSCLGAYESAVLSALNVTMNLATVTPIAAVDLSVLAGNADATCDDDNLKPAIDRLRVLGILTIAAAGNDGLQGVVARPSCISTALTVSSVVYANPYPQGNHGPLVDILAPGESVVSGWPGKTYWPVTGTQMAAAHVTGAVAMLKSLKPAATPLEIETALKAGGVPTRASSWSWTTPRVDLLAAALRIMGVNLPLRGTAITGVRASAASGAQSYLRFHNADEVNGTISVTVVDEATGQTLGIWSREIPLQTSPQFSASTIEAQAIPTITPDPARRYTLYVDATMAGHAQHVTWDPLGRLLTNVTACASGLSADGRTIINVHTSQLPRYPSFLQITNTGTAAAVPTFAVTDSRDSTPLGIYHGPNVIGAGQTEILGVSNVLEALGRPPNAVQYHVEMRLESAFSGSVRHLVLNADAGILTDTSAKCDM